MGTKSIPPKGHLGAGRYMRAEGFSEATTTLQLFINMRNLHLTVAEVGSPRVKAPTGPVSGEDVSFVAAPMWPKRVPESFFF